MPEQTVPDWVLEEADQHPNTVAVSNPEDTVSYTYAELVCAVDECAARLGSLPTGTILTLCAPNSPHHVVAYLAASRAGLTVLHLNPADTPDEIGEAMSRAGSTVIVTAAHATAGLVGAGYEVIDLEELVGAAPAAARSGPTRLVHPGEVSSLLQSSGTTGLPKLVELTHRNVVAAALQTLVEVPVPDNGRVLAVAPFHHAFGLVMVLAATLRQGATLITLERFDPVTFLTVTEKRKITRLYVVPTLVSFLAKDPRVDKFDVSSLETMISGGAALDPDLAQRCRERLRCGLAQGYGMTEAMMSVMQTDFHDTSGSVGSPAVNVNVKIVDPSTGDPVPDGHVGEVLINGPHVARRYRDDPEATAAALDRDGFLRTGDLGRVDDRGQLVLTDRLKEVIKYKAQQVSPTELEGVIGRHPHVVDVAVVGVPDETAGEIPKAFVVVAGTVTPQEVMDYVNERVAPYKKVRECEVVDHIPKTPVGKIARHLLKESTRGAA